MIPLKLTLSGFMSYRDAQTLDFQDDSLWVLVGKNASGKSSIFDAIIFALFGETRVAGINNNELINHHSDAAEIIFDFAANGAKYRVKRTIPKKGSATRQASLLLQKPDGSLSPQPIPGTHMESGFKKWIETELGINYEVFITSILLRQGKADAFLEAGTSTRYDVLSKLIDLSKYIALAEKAREKKNYWRDQASFHRDNLDRISPVTEQDLTDAQMHIDLEDKAVESARQCAEQLQALYGQASRWGQLDSDMILTERRIFSAQALVDRSEEIENNYRRLIDLRTVLPALKAVFDLAQAISQDEAEIARLTSEDRIDSELIKAAEIEVGNLKSSFDMKDKQLRDKNAEVTRIYRRISELSPLLGIISQIGQLERTLEKHRETLAIFPDSLDTLLNASETKRDQLDEIERVLPGLKRLASDRSRLSDTVQCRISLLSQLSEKQKARPNMAKAQEGARTQYSEAETCEKGMRKAHTEVNTLLAEARKHLSNFNLVAGTARCQYCGKELSEEHKVDERSRLLKDLAEKEQFEKAALENLTTAVKNREQAQELLRSANANLSDLDGEMVSISQEIRGLDQQIQAQLSDLSMSYDALPVVYQTSIFQGKPSTQAEWINTVYPQASDLAELAGALKLLPQIRSDAASFAKQVGERNQAHARWSETNGSLENARRSLPPDWEALQLENEQLSSSKIGIDASLDAAKQTQEAAKDAYEKARAQLELIRNRQSRRSGTLTMCQAAVEKNQSNHEAQIALLPGEWQAEAHAMTQIRFSVLETEKRGLERYEEQHQQLAAAGQGLIELKAHKLEMQGLINEIPTEARRSPEQVNKELSDALEERREAESQLSAAQTRRLQMLEQRRLYKETESNMKASERKSHLYGILSEQFGERGIQKAIINKAELAIVYLSNQVLDSLSGGRSKLRLREAGGNKKALDLEVWDSQTGGDKPILTCLASGSQRFRIAISVALGIGKYIGRESNRIESVIIDEGFGSLDREGRESIIQELYNLRQHLKRIILVSHQEEFSRGFSTGYEIQLVDGASQVKPLVR